MSAKGHNWQGRWKLQRYAGISVKLVVNVFWPWDWLPGIQVFRYAGTWRAYWLCFNLYGEWSFE